MLFSLLAEKRKELGDAAAKLRNGLDKIDETRAKVLNLRVYWPRRIFK
jgi:dynein heavy chain